MFTVHFIDGVADGEHFTTPDKPPTVVTVDEGLDAYLLILEVQYGLWVEDGSNLYYRPEHQLREIANYADDGNLGDLR